MRYAVDALQENDIREGDVVTFGNDPMRWIITSVKLENGTIVDFSIRPEAVHKIRA